MRVRERERQRERVRVRERERIREGATHKRYPRTHTQIHMNSNLERERNTHR